MYLWLFLCKDITQVFVGKSLVWTRDVSYFSPGVLNMAAHMAGGKPKVILCFHLLYTHLALRWKNLEESVYYRFGLVSLFNGISTFVGYLMPKPSF